MKGTRIFAALLGLGFMWATSANAAVSVTLTPVSTTATPGSTITLRTIATQNGTETDDTIFGAINFNDAQLNSNVAGNSQVPLFNTIGALTCTTAFCVAFSQVQSDGVKSVNITNQQIATTTFIVDPATPVNTVLTFAWRTSPSTQRFDWFGLTNAPGTTVTVIPEPTTVGMLGLGLLGLALGGRKRS
jgi:PEP-CTERM motif-containing protein